MNYRTQIIGFYFVQKLVFRDSIYAKRRVGFDLNTSHLHSQYQLPKDIFINEFQSTIVRVSLRFHEVQLLYSNSDKWPILIIKITFVLPISSLRSVAAHAVIMIVNGQNHKIELLSSALKVYPQINGIS